MNGQQFFLSVFLSGLCLAAVPGVFQQPPRETSADQSQKDTARKLDSELKSKIPETRLELAPTTEAEKREIKFARKININTVGKDKLQKIPGVGPATAQKIIEFRQAGNNFYSVEDMEQIGGIGPTTVENLRPNVTVGKEYLDKEKSRDESGPVDLNTASIDQLKEVPGVGQVTARKILSYRDKYGGFRAPSDLKNISNIGPKTYQRLKDHVEASTVRGITAPEPETSEPEEINVNEAGKSQLMKLPGVGPKTARDIVEYREKHGRFEEVDDLDKVSGIGSVTLGQLRGKVTLR